MDKSCKHLKIGWCHLCVIKALKPICVKCYGKGYATEMTGETILHKDFIGDTTQVIDEGGIRINYCNCDRGKQLESVVKEEIKRALESVVPEKIKPKENSDFWILQMKSGITVSSETYQYFNEIIDRINSNTKKYLENNEKSNS